MGKSPYIPLSKRGTEGDLDLTSLELPSRLRECLKSSLTYRFQVSFHLGIGLPLPLWERKPNPNLLPSREKGLASSYTGVRALLFQRRQCARLFKHTLRESSDLSLSIRHNGPVIAGQNYLKYPSRKNRC